jgi:hypothetical protein
MKKSFGFIAVCACALGSLGAQTVSPVADGILGVNEYAVTGTYGDLVLGVSLSADKSTLHVGVVSPSTGWVAAGFGTGMNGAFMVLAYDDAGTVAVSEDTGKMFTHSPNASKILTAEAVREKDGKTTLEFTVPSGNFVKNGKLPMILAWSDKDSFSAKHRKYAKASLSIAK